MSAPALRIHGPVLPDGEVRDLYVVDGRVTYERQPGAELVAEGWVVPGLVDAHNHLGLDDGGAVDDAEVERQALADRDTGALLLRDCGSPADTRWVHERDDLPLLIRCGRHVARTRRYLQNYGQEVEPDGLADAVAEQAQAGDGWVKLVGDWIDRGVGDLAPLWTDEELAAAIKVAHDAGAKVTAHVFGEDALPGLINAGIDYRTPPQRGADRPAELVVDTPTGSLRLIVRSVAAARQLSRKDVRLDVAQVAELLARRDQSRGTRDDIG